MRLLITAVIAGNPVDLAVDAEDAARVADLAATLAEAFGVPEVPGETPVLRVVGSADAPTRRAAPALFLEQRQLDPDEPVATSAIRHAAIVGVGAPVDTALLEPRGLVEIRVVSGPGAGLVSRLDPGQYTIGSGLEADLRLDDPQLPAISATVVVRADGRVEFQPVPEVVGVRRPAPHRTRPLDGPIVLDTLAPDLPRRRRRTSDELPEGTRTVDPADDIALANTDRSPIDGPVAWAPGQGISLGTVLLVLETVTPPDAALSRNPAGATLDFNRPPRLLPAVRRTSFSLPAEPRRPEKSPLPLLIAYQTVRVREGRPLFLPDVYGLDAQLQAALDARPRPDRAR